VKLAFSTLGCPGWSFREIISTARDAGFDAIEIRGIGEQMFAPDIPEFSDEKIGETLRLLAAVKLDIPVLTSGATLADPQKAQESFEEACAYIRLAPRLGASYVRVMGTGAPQPEEGDWALAARLYAELCAFAAPFGVTPLLETNGELASSRKMAELVRGCGAGNAGVLWDVHHTVRFAGESPGQTAEQLGDLIRHVHLKDSVIQNGRPAYRMMGYGDIPVPEAVAALEKAGYQGYFCLEWVKRWNPDLQEPGIVFSHFKSYMDMLSRSLPPV